MTETVGRAAAAAAALGLTGDAGFDDAPLSDADWQQLMRIGDRQRLTGLLVAAVAIGALPVTERQRDDLATRDERWQGHALMAEGQLTRIVEMLGEHGIESRVIKGPALAHTIYDAPEHRVFGDLDILVPGPALTSARELLTTGLGAHDPLPELVPGFDAEFAKDVLLRLDGLEIDLHRTIAAGPFGLRFPAPELFDDARAFSVGTTTAWTLSPTATLVQVCCNATLGDVPPRLISLRDVAQAVTRFTGDAAAIGELSTRWRLDAPVSHAITHAWETLRLAPHPLHEWAAARRTSWFDRQLLTASTSTSRAYTRQVAAVAAIPGVRRRLRYARAILSPQRAYLEARGWKRGDHVKRAWARLRSARRPT